MIDNILAKYPNDVKLVIKNYPLSFHKQAQKVAKYALAAHKQGKYKEIYHKIMRNYKKLKTNEDLPLEYAKELGLDMNQFIKDFESPEIVFEAALAHEQKVTGEINNIFTMAREASIWHIEVAFQWFITEQVEEEVNARDNLARIKMAGDNPGSEEETDWMKQGDCELYQYGL